MAKLKKNQVTSLSTSDISGLGTIATQASNNVTITGGSVTGITDLALADGGTGSSTAAGAFDNLKQNASAAATGVVELATDAETNTGTDTTRAITPSNLEAWNGSAQVTTLGTITSGAWNGTDVAVADGGTGSSTAAGARTNLSTAQAPTLDTAANLASNNPVLASGQVGYATDTDILKVGDGSTAWNSLPSFHSHTDPQRASAVGQVLSITSIVDLNTSSITFTVSTTPWMVTLHVPVIFGQGAEGDSIEVTITDASNTTTGVAAKKVAIANEISSITVYEYISTPGTYTRKGRIRRSAGTTATIGYGSTTSTQFIMAAPVS